MVSLRNFGFFAVDRGEITFSTSLSEKFDGAPAANPPLRANRKHVDDGGHSDHQHRFHRARDLLLQVEEWRLESGTVRRI